LDRDSESVFEASNAQPALRYATPAASKEPKITGEVSHRSGCGRLPAAREFAERLRSIRAPRTTPLQEGQPAREDERYGLSACSPSRSALLVMLFRACGRGGRSWPETGRKRL